MKRRIGTYIVKKVTGESYNAYVPANLPPIPRINLETLYSLLEKATLALAELNSVTSAIPNTSGDLT